MPLQHYNLIVIGAGALGSFHAYHACKTGLKVLLFEKDTKPMEATVRNFGQVVPSGMSQGKWQDYGRRSLEVYDEIQAQTDISVRKNGTIYIASDDTELALINELHDINKKNSYPSTILSKEMCLQQYSGLKKEYCKGGLFFEQELTIEPDKMIHRLIQFMQDKYALEYKPSTAIINCDFMNGNCWVEDNTNHHYTADKVIICNGRDFKKLFPTFFLNSDIEVSKLQMMRTLPQPGIRIKGSVLSGLSIRRYESFAECSSFEVAGIEPVSNFNIKKWGIHILFKQAEDGSIIIGDSHEYAPANQQDLLGYEINQHINHLILSEAKKIFKLPTWEIASTWNGYYAQTKNNGGLFYKELAPNIHAITAIGGKGMTASAGLAEETIRKLFS